MVIGLSPSAAQPHAAVGGKLKCLRRVAEAAAPPRPHEVKVSYAWAPPCQNRALHLAPLSHSERSEEMKMRETMREDEEKTVVEHCCSLSMRAHSSPSSSPFIVESVSFPRSEILAFSASWSADDWILDDGVAAAAAAAPFGDSEVDLSVFPSLKTVGPARPARANAAFVCSFQRLLAYSRLQEEVQRAVAEKKRIVFTGHSSGGAISVLATVWLLEQSLKSDDGNQILPLCVTFGSPLVGDSVFCHALQREDWSRCFVHFVMPLDIIPRISLSPLSLLKEEFQPILHFTCPNPIYSTLDSVEQSQLVTLFYGTVLRNALSISKHQACLSMACSNSLLGALTPFVKLAPYRPFGEYVFSTRNSLFRVKNSDAILHLLFYCLQWASELDVTEVAYRSLQEHLQYELMVKKYLEVHNILYVDCLEKVPLSLNDEYAIQMPLVATVCEELDLTTEARLCLRAAGECENHRRLNQERIDVNYRKIHEALRSLKDYRATCELRGLGYYDAFKLQKDPEDFNANVKRLELAGLWDEIVDMLRRHQLPDNFECRAEWIKLGTSYRCLVEPLDIANYYRHAKNEDTGPYIANGRPKRYVNTQRWLEHAQRVRAGSRSESCFWAMVEEMCFDSKPFDEARERVVKLESEVLQWLADGKLGGDALLGGSTFVGWWKALPVQHRLGSCIAGYMNGEVKVVNTNLL